MKLEEPCVPPMRGTVPWERKGENPLRDPIIANANRRQNINNFIKKINRK
jgi:hypothetical protein